MTTTERPTSLLAYPATYLLIAINVAVYAAMCRFGPVPAMLRQIVLTLRFASTAGVHPGLLHALAREVGDISTAPFRESVLLYFGSSATGNVILRGQWWRLVTANFVHVHLLHLLLNMWCLWNLGLFGEPLLGRPGLFAVYLLTGVAGMLQSLAFSLYTGRWDIVAGASGAVFGIAGILIVLLSNRKLALPWKELRSLRMQVIFFAGANLLLGILPQALPALSASHLKLLHLDPQALPQIDNSAHIGGLLCGLALGVPLFPRLTSGKSSYHARQVLVFSAMALLLVLGGYALASFAHPNAGS